MVCNVLLEAVTKESVKSIVPEKIFKKYDSFDRCPGCCRIYWLGTHWEHMIKRLGSMLPAGE
jgi:uncharacterized protein with PIN domain